MPDAGSTTLIMEPSEQALVGYTEIKQVTASPR